MSKRINELLDAEGAAAEQFEEDQSAPYPENVKISRGNPRSKVLQVRLNPDEYAAIERIAAQRKLPASTVAREQLLKLITDQDIGTPPATQVFLALGQVESQVAEIRRTLVENLPADFAAGYNGIIGQAMTPFLKACTEDDGSITTTSTTSGQAVRNPKE